MEKLLHESIGILRAFQLLHIIQLNLDNGLLLWMRVVPMPGQIVAQWLAEWCKAIICKLAVELAPAMIGESSRNVLRLVEAVGIYRSTLTQQVNHSTVLEPGHDDVPPVLRWWIREHIPLLPQHEQVSWRPHPIGNRAVGSTEIHRGNIPEYNIS